MLHDFRPEIFDTRRGKRGLRSKGRILIATVLACATIVPAATLLTKGDTTHSTVAGLPTIPDQPSMGPTPQQSLRIGLALPSQAIPEQNIEPVNQTTPQLGLQPLPLKIGKQPESDGNPDLSAAKTAESAEMPLATLPQPVERTNRDLTPKPEPAVTSRIAIDTESVEIDETRVTGDIQEAAVHPQLPASVPGTWVEDEVKPGDSLAKIFSRHKLSANLLHRIVHSSKEAKKLARIKPGETLRFRLDDEGNLLELVHRQSPIRSAQILADGDGFTLNKIERGLEKRVAHSSGTITDSLYQSAQREGLSDALIMELANIFGWDVDFALEIRAGDRFSLIYEEKYLDGEKYSNGTILAAEFVNRGKVYRAIRYEDETGHGSYFSPDGNSMHKVFLRAPVDFRRISSRFTRARWHPVLGKKRSHRGVDYAAATGTPIKAAGDGRVIYRGWKGGYGKTVIIQHGQKITTLYGHMSKYRGSVKKGTRVSQGQVIGYVGKTGLATGPHLHYEFRVNGVHRNPLTVKLPPSSPIDKKYRKDFENKSAPLLAKLDQMSRTMVAAAE